MSKAIRIRGLDHIVLRVADLDRTLFFYQDVLGCEVERRVDDIGLVQLRAGAALIDVVPVDSKLGRQGGAPPGREGHNVDHFCLAIEDFDGDALLAHLERFGVPLVGEIGTRYGAAGFGPSLYVADPDGNTVELKGSG